MVHIDWVWWWTFDTTRGIDNKKQVVGLGRFFFYKLLYQFAVASLCLLQKGKDAQKHIHRLQRLVLWVQTPLNKWKSRWLTLPIAQLVDQHQCWWSWSCENPGCFGFSTGVLYPLIIGINYSYPMKSLIHPSNILWNPTFFVCFVENLGEQWPKTLLICCI